MSFQGSADNVRVDDGHWLRARLNNGQDFVDAEIDLDTIIGNDNGRFSWGGNGFSGSAQDVSFNFEGDNQPILRARLFNLDGQAIDADINLAERIGNDNGGFNYQQ